MQIYTVKLDSLPVYILRFLHEEWFETFKGFTTANFGGGTPCFDWQADPTAPRESASEDLTSAQKSVIHRLEQDGPVTVSTLSRAESVRPQSMRVTVASLEKLGLVSGIPDPTDGRKTFFSLTAACRETLRSGRAAREDWLTRALQAQLTPREQEQLAAAVELFKRLADF